MKLLADESIEYRVVTGLRKKGYDVISIFEKSPSDTDVIVLHRAYKEKRILLTNDTDFGELVYHKKLPHAGVVLFRLPIEDAQSKLKRLLFFLETTKEDLRNKFTVISEHKVRIRRGR